MYTNRKGFMLAQPPMLELAWTNLTHWQSYSDQRNILRFARCGTIFSSGVAAEELEGFSVGPNSLVRAESEGADMKYVEHTGKAIGEGKADLDSLEERMEHLAMEPFLARTGNETATGRGIDEAKSQADIKSWVTAEQAVLLDAYQLAANWVNVELPEDLAISIFSDFGISIRAQEDLKHLIEARKNREISRELYLQEIKRRGLLDDAVDLDDEMERLESEVDDLPQFSMAVNAPEVA
jgi:hypothetical protein